MSEQKLQSEHEDKDSGVWLSLSGPNKTQPQSAEKPEDDTS